MHESPSTEWFMELVKRMDEREKVLRAPPLCPHCESNQVQTIDWEHRPPEWRCRKCHRFFFKDSRDRAV